MKPFLGVDLTDNKKNEQYHGYEFLVQAVPDALSRSLDASTERAEENLERSKIPLFFRILQYICALAALILAGGILDADVSIAEGYRNAPWLFWATGICAVVWLVLWLWGCKKSNTVLGDDESAQSASHLESTSRAIYSELEVPADAPDVDVLMFFYKRKNGDIKVVEKGLQICSYLNPEFKIFADGEYLYLANLEGKFAFPLSAITAIRTVKKHIRIMQWNKEVQCNKDIYKPYRLTTDNMDCVHCKCYHIVEIQYNGETYGIYIPSYELPVFERLTGIKAQP